MIDAGRDRDELNELAGLLTSHVRQADEIGYLDEHRLCVLLTYTVPSGAGQFMVRILELANTIGQKPSTHLYVYPSDPPENHDEDKNHPPVKSRRADALHPTSDDVNYSSRVLGAGVEALLARQPPLWKRATDVVVSVIAILTLWPLGLLIALAIKLTSKGPVFFTQWRMGLGGRPFLIFKFRTMVTLADQLKHTLLHRNEQDGPAFKMKCDPRVTRLGLFLRRTSLDELPQLLNVLRGEMSLVGPRPLPIAEAMACHAWQKRRLDVVPGLTCTWQIKGRGKVTFSEWVRMDREYIRRQSFLYDAKLLALTVPAILSRRGAM